jgi:hypothetical protein
LSVNQLAMFRLVWLGRLWVGRLRRGVWQAVGEHCGPNSARQSIVVWCHCAGGVGSGVGGMVAGRSGLCGEAGFGKA